MFLKNKFIVAGLLMFIICAVNNQAQKKSFSNEKPYIGCWSAGNKDATVMYISSKILQTSNNFSQRFSYIVISADVNKKTYLLKLLQKDKNNFLQKYEKISFVGDDEILLEDYESEADFKKGNSVGGLRFAKDACKNVLPLLKRQQRQNEGI